MKQCFILMVCLLNLLGSPLVITDNFASQGTLEHSEYLVTQTRDIHQLDHTLFKPLTKVNLGYVGSSIVWTKVALVNDSTTPKRMVALNTRPGMDEISMYLLRDKSIVESHFMGDTLPFAPRPLKSIRSAIPFTIEANETLELYIMHANKGTMVVETILYSPSDFFYAESHHLVNALLLFAFMCVIVFYIIYLVGILKRKVFLLFIIHLIFMFIYYICVNGLFYFLTEGEMVAFQEFIVYYGIFIGSFALILFDVYFFNLKSIAPKLFATIVVSASLALLALSTINAQDYHPFFKAIASLSAFYFLVVYGAIETVLVYALYKRLPFSIYYFIGHSASTTGAIIYFETLFGKVPENSFTQNAGMIGLIVEGLVIGFAVHQSLTKSLEEKQKAEELLVAHSQFLSVGRELAAIVHQWRMPLYRMSTIAMYLESLLLKKSVSTEKLSPSIEHLNQTIAFMDETITSFHNFYRREDVQKEFNVYEKIEKIVDMLKPLLQSHRIEVKNGCDKEMFLHAKSDILGHIVLILLQNAITALSVSSQKTREISLSNFTTLDYIGIRVEDNGGGIEPSKLPHLFSETLRSDNGLGFGLQLAYFLASKELGGKIQAYNSDKGAVFEVLMLTQHV